MRTLILAAAAAASLGAGAAQAATVIEAREFNGNVLVFSSGSLDLTGLGAPEDAVWVATPAVYADFPAINVGSGGRVDAYADPFTVTPAPFGEARSGAPFFADISMGNTIGVSGRGISGGPDYLYLTPGYASGDPIDGMSIFRSTSLFQLGMTAGTPTTWSLRNGDTITVSAIPLPAGAWLALAGVGVLAGLGVRARRRAA